MSRDAFLGKYLSMAGPDEARNKVFIGVTKINGTILERIKALAERLGIPADAIMVEKAGILVPDVPEGKLNATIKLSKVEISLPERSSIQPPENYTVNSDRWNNQETLLRPLFGVFETLARLIDWLIS
ncbi:hypothetical protein [Archaeoglobus fulgidus]|jgi:hypothetical protein|uniref:Uncharacterized protein AF_2135 n=3 Tax=Archaeoglobus fulgidus TaxID=2234 RepID=Y2135_ARCFU|nr:hypothetical protein [Archaeoglobus fulgidus]O28145.1 RecName: Full=Uncharacterized protein AF_2135 [Archaeoglobus fulgidus DSM 4304]AAB89125.1 predicted coding region AF_2135 [Archaeoglobus fulgidus DSM 4304]AIG99122.1 hypothetical protein AFULGI_00024050 [Archaeoglobus fulgidus DSM 8774]KUJ94181.1 MAG: hypothetical protein XD40_0666 [Archaeoglobus fulgidus]KUK05750.1 MAG: Uncharacterized protein XD48_2017 [Archaeoglobus fulgidus]